MPSNQVEVEFPEKKEHIGGINCMKIIALVCLPLLSITARKLPLYLAESHLPGQDHHSISLTLEELQSVFTFRFLQGLKVILSGPCLLKRREYVHV